MKKILATSMIAALISSPLMAQEIKPLDTTASTQAENLPVIDTIPTGAIVLGGVVILAGVAIGLSGGDSANGT